MKCEVGECERPVKARKMCGAHYRRWQRTGDPDASTPLPTYKPLPRKLKPGVVFGELTLIEQVEDGSWWKCKCSCGVVKPVRRQHLNDKLHRHCGDTAKHQSGERSHHWAGSEIAYGGAHDRVRRERGSASKYDCVDCGKPAREWSYNGGAPDEREYDDPRCDALLKYSPTPSYYVARCAPCHKIYDN